jgi:tryptophanyl-tRNA synthetase
MDEPDAIRKKVMRAVTDTGPEKENQEKPEVIQNIFSLLKLVSSEDTYSHFDSLYNSMKIRYGDLKKQLAEDMIKFTQPFLEKMKAISSDESYLKEWQRKEQKSKDKCF